MPRRRERTRARRANDKVIESLRAIVVSGALWTRPLDHADLDNAIAEVRDAFQIGSGQLQRITDWTNLATKPPEQLARNPRTRW